MKDSLKKNTCFLHDAIHVMHHETGIVISVYLPEGIDSSYAETLLRENVAMCCEQVKDPSKICLSVDGEKFGNDIVRPVSREFNVSTVVCPTSRGKLQAVAYGVRCLLDKHLPKYIALIDQDGDHFANELLNFIRTAQHIAANVQTDRILVLGRRISRHRPMGFLRGELEELADRVLLDALSFNATVTGKPLRLEYALTLDEFPDFHSGYKLFSQATAKEVFLKKPQLAGVSETCYYRHACEAVMVVEALLSGAYFGTVNRSTLNRQPISTFGLLNLSRLVADKIIWPCKRLNIPLPFVKQWMSNHTPRLLLNTLAPHGKEELEKIRKLVVEAWGGAEDPDNRTVFEPLFL